MSKRQRAAARRATIRDARMDDVEAIHALVTEFSRQEFMLPRSRSELYDSLRDFEVAEVGGEVVGCAALSIVWEGMAEIQSLAVRDGYQRRGIGRRLVKACLAEARRLGALKVFALTAVPAFFERMGFSYVPRETLPHKIWSDCVKCVKFPHCNELAVAIDLPPPRARTRRGAGDRGGA
jgi:amino-acid N-acetyltransferase